MPRLVRRAPLSERIKAYLDPWDWLMWASEELNSSDWDEFAKDYATPLGIGMNVVFMVAKANTGGSSTSGGDDVFRDESRGSGWLKWFAGGLVFILSTLSFLNGFYTFYRKRHYRLFEQPIEMNPSTPSAQRVRVDSSPSTASPLRFLQNMVSGSAASRAHPDAGRDVWEIAVWDPNPLCLQLFCIFSPLHVILYYANLPVEKLDPRPSVKVVATVLIAILLTLQLSFLQKSFKQQIKDSAIIHREVLHEYDTKYVHPAFQKPSRDVAIQTISKDKNSRDSSVGVRGSGELASEVVTYTPTTIIKRGFHTNPNQAYASQYDPDGLSSQSSFQPRLTQQTPSARSYTTSNYTNTSTATTGAEFSSPIRPTNTPNPFRQPQFRQSQVGSGDGGSLGVFSHAASPLRKSASANSLGHDRPRQSLGGNGERRAVSPTKREGSPLKRMSTPSGFTGADARTSGANLTDRFNKGYTGLGVGRRESGRF